MLACCRNDWDLLRATVMKSEFDRLAGSSKPLILPRRAAAKGVIF